MLYLLHMGLPLFLQGGRLCQISSRCPLPGWGLVGTSQMGLSLLCQSGLAAVGLFWKTRTFLEKTNTIKIVYEI